MDRLGVWGTDTEMFTLSHHVQKLLDTDTHFQ